MGSILLKSSQQPTIVHQHGRLEERGGAFM